jgi:hypothetical protein
VVHQRQGGSEEAECDERHQSIGLRGMSRVPITRNLLRTQKRCRLVC